jgi:hypothetical protein
MLLLILIVCALILVAVLWGEEGFWTALIGGTGLVGGAALFVLALLASVAIFIGGFIMLAMYG